MADRRPKNPTDLVSEQAFQTKVIHLARVCGWRVHHVRAGRTQSGRWATHVQGDVGFCDLVLIHEKAGLALFRELKRNAGRLEPAQQAWGEAMTAAGLDWGVWRPKDWRTVEETLTGPVRSTPGGTPPHLQVAQMELSEDPW